MNTPIQFQREHLFQRDQLGLTLIEVLLVLGISTFILLTIGYRFVSLRAAEQHRSALVSIQDGARIGLERLGTDLRQAGYVGCNSQLQRNNFAEKMQFESAVLPLRNPLAVAAGVENFTIDSKNAARVFNSSSSSDVWGGTAPTNAIPDTHVIEVRYATADGASLLSGPISADGLRLQTESSVALGREDENPTSASRMALLSDCASGLIVLADAVNGSVVTTQTLPIDSSRCQSASRAGSSCFYWPATVLMPIRVVQYYVANEGTATQPKRGLYMRKRIMTDQGITWNKPVQILDNVLSLRVSGLGLDVAAPATPTWSVTREVLETTSPTAIETLSSEEWARVVRIDVRIAMKADKAVGNDKAPVIRNFETSYAIRSRVAGDIL